MANIFNPSFVDLPVDVFLHIFSYLDLEDVIALALTCKIFRQICVDAKVFRKMDLSRSVISTTHRKVTKSLFRDRQLTQHVRELNVSNLRVLNWQMDDQLEEFIVSICPHLEALHVLDCGVSLQTLQRILKEARQLTSLSWSIWDFTSEDVEFLLKTMESPEGICLKNIKHLHLQMSESKSQMQIAKYLLLSCCRDLEELEVYTWRINETFCTGGNFPLAADLSIPGFHLPSVENELNNLNSLMVVNVGCPQYETRREEFFDFVVSILSRKSSSTKWKKFCILLEMDITTKEFSQLLHKVHSDDFQSLEAIAADASESHDAVDEVKRLFERIGDNTVRRLQLHLPPDSDLIVEFCEPISRVAGRSLKFLCLSVSYPEEVRAEQNASIHSLFSNCLNITELTLLECGFEKDLCEPLSELKHLTKVQLRECAISSKYSSENEIEISKADLLTFVENCKNITHLDVRGCWDCHEHFFCRLTDDDLLALAKLSNLKSLTLYEISGITEWMFLQNISENCKFLTMLRIKDCNHFNNSHIPILMEASRFLKHLAIKVNVSVLESEVFWNLLSHAKNLERLCIRSHCRESLNIPAVAVETLKSLPQLHVLHLHAYNKMENDDDFYHQLIRMLKEKESDCRFSFEIVTRNESNTWINHPSGYSLISNKALHLNIIELCDMTPIVSISRF